MTKSELELHHTSLAQHNDWMEEKIKDLSDVGDRMVNWLVTWADSAPIEQKRNIKALILEWQMATQVTFQERKDG